MESDLFLTALITEISDKVRLEIVRRTAKRMVDNLVMSDHRDRELSRLINLFLEEVLGKQTRRYKGIGTVLL